MNRIEVMERVEQVDPEELEMFESMGIKPKNKKIVYRRVLLRCDQIFAVKEIPTQKHICLIQFMDDATMVVRHDFDDFAIALNDVEHNDLESDDEPDITIEDDNHTEEN